MIYSEEDFDKLTYPVHKLDPSKSIMETYKEFKSYPEFNLKTTFEPNKLLRYIIYCYDPYTPFKREPDLPMQKMMAADKAGFKHKQGIFEDEVNALMMCKSEEANRMVIRYCRMNHAPDFALMTATMQNFNNVLLMSMKTEALEGKEATVVAKGKNELLNQAKTQLADIRKDMAKVFNGDSYLFDLADLVLMSENPQMIGGGIAEMFAKPNKGAKKADVED